MLDDTVETMPYLKEKVDNAIDGVREIKSEPNTDVLSRIREIFDGRNLVDPYTGEVKSIKPTKKELHRMVSDLLDIISDYELGKKEAFQELRDLSSTIGRLRENITTLDDIYHTDLQGRTSKMLEREV